MTNTFNTHAPIANGDSYRGIIWKPQRGETIVAPGFNPG